MWEYYNPVKINFGRSIRSKIFSKINSDKILLICSKKGKQRFISDKILSKIVIEKNIIWLDQINDTPDIQEIDNHISNLKDEKFELIIAFGGGSVIDSAKAIFFYYNCKNKNLTIKDLISRDVKINFKKKVSLLVLPTTSGTGSEVTQFATIWDKQNKKKYSIDNERIFPDFAFIDSELTDGLPEDITLYTGLDAINQSIESMWNKNASDFTIHLAIKSLKLGFNSIKNIFKKKDSPLFRNNMSQSSMLSGLCISQTRTAICHSISYPLTSHYSVPHGLACSFTMLEVLKKVIKKDDGRFKKLATELGISNGKASDLISLFEDFDRKCQIKEKIKYYINDLDLLLELVPEMYTKERADKCLVSFDLKDIKRIVANSYQNS